MTIFSRFFVEFQHAKGIEQSVCGVFSTIPEDFQLKPAAIRKTAGCGMFYDFKVGLPGGQYAKVSFHTGGYPLPRTPGQKQREQNYKVDPTPTELDED